MEVIGMKKDNKVIEMKPKVKVSIKILPFGSVSYEITGGGHNMEEKESEMPRYIEPLTTNVEKVDILYEGGKTYSVPKTTIGR